VGLLGPGGRSCQPGVGEGSSDEEHPEHVVVPTSEASGDSAVQLHLVMDNYATHKEVALRDWLAANPRIHVHFTLTSGSWLDLVEVWFSIIERQAIYRGTFTFRGRPQQEDPRFVDGWNDHCHPIVWTKTRQDPQERQPSDNFKDGPLA